MGTTANEAPGSERIAVGEAGTRPSYLRADLDRASSLAVSWRGLLFATLLLACLAVLMDFVL